MKETVIRKSIFNDFKELCNQSGIDYTTFCSSSDDAESAIDSYLEFLGELVNISLKYGGTLYRNEIESYDC